MPVTFYFYLFWTKYKFNILSTLYFCSLMNKGVVDLDVWLPCEASNKPHNHGGAIWPKSLFIKGLGEGGVWGFCLV